MPTVTLIPSPTHRMHCQCHHWALSDPAGEHLAGPQTYPCIGQCTHPDAYRQADDFLDGPASRYAYGLDVCPNFDAVTRLDIGIDFDGTLTLDPGDSYPIIAPPRWPLVRLCRLWAAQGHRLVLITLREDGGPLGNVLSAALDWCTRRGLTFAAVNDNLPDRSARWGSNPRKVAVDVMIDDRARWISQAGPLAAALAARRPETLALAARCPEEE